MTTDWGVGDPYAALFKALVWKQNPQAVFADVSHQVKDSNLYQAAYLLDTVCWNFPNGSVHVVDCRKFTLEQCVRISNKERPLLFTDFIGIRCRGQYFLLENSGMFSLLCPDFKDVEAVVKLIECKAYAHFNTFNALNYYADAAARLTAGASLADVGEVYPLENLQRITPYKVRTSKGTVTGRICHIDAFGNLLTDIRAEDLAEAGLEKKKIKVQVLPCMEKLQNVTLQKRYFSVSDYNDFAVFNVNGYLEIGRKNDSLADALFEDDSGIGDEIMLTV